MEKPIKYGASYKSNTGLAVNTPETIFSPAANVNGAILWAASHISQASGVPYSSFLAKTSAPATSLDGDAVLSPNMLSLIVASNTYGSGSKLDRPVFIPAGKGLYFISPVAETGAIRSALYTLL